YPSEAAVGCNFERYPSASPYFVVNRQPTTQTGNIRGGFRCLDCDAYTSALNALCCSDGRTLVRPVNSPGYVNSETRLQKRRGSITATRVDPEDLPCHLGQVGNDGSPFDGDARINRNTVFAVASKPANWVLGRLRNPSRSEKQTRGNPFPKRL